MVLRRVNLRKCTVLESLAKVPNLVANRTDRLVTQHSEDLFRRNMIITLVQGLGNFYLHLQIGQLRLNELCDLYDFVVFKTEIKRPAVDKPGICFDQDAVEIHHVCHPNVGSALLSAVDGDYALANSIR